MLKTIPGFLRDHKEGVPGASSPMGPVWPQEPASRVHTLREQGVVSMINF